MNKLTEEIKEQKIKKYQKRIYILFRSLYRVFEGSPLAIQMVDKYVEIYRPPKDHFDTVLLPFESKGKKAKKAKKIDCFFALLNNVVLEFWTFHKTQENEGNLLDAIIEAEGIIEKGLANYKIVGSDTEGYYLV